MSAGRIASGMLAGVAIGAVIGILFAPEKGSTMRKRFSKKRYDFTEELEEKFNSLIDNITEQFETVVEEATLITEKNNAKMAHQARMKATG